VVQDDGNVVIYRPNNTPAWATNTLQSPMPLGPHRQRDGMQPDDVLTPDDSVTSADGPRAVGVGHGGALPPAFA
jgi:hypothetical protein